MDEISRVGNDLGAVSVTLQIDASEPEQDEELPRAGQVCQKCQSGVLDYDGLLNLVCPNCGLIESGCFT